MTTVIALLNVISTVFLLAAIYWIRKKNRKRHVQFIVLSLVTASLLIGVFLYDKMVLSDSLKSYMKEGIQGSTGMKWFLGSHILASVITIPLVVRTIHVAIKNRLSEHKLWAKWTASIWLYASVTGVLLYALFL